MKLFLSLLLLFITSFSFAQKKQNIYYLNDDGRFVSNKDSFNYVRIIEEPDSGETNFIFKEFYTNNAKKSVGFVSKFEPNLVFEGTLISFYKNGQKKSIVNYVKDTIVGSAYYFYPNGKFQEERDYPAYSSVKNSSPASKPSNAEKTKDEQLKPVELKAIYKTVQYADSNGTEFLDKNSTGRVKIGTESTDNIAGNYLNGFKDGEWKEYVKKDSTTFLDIYDNGKFVKGKRIKDNGGAQEYDHLMVQPEFKGGMKKFYQFLSDKLKYPDQAERKNIEGKVYLEFVVNKDGSIEDIWVLKGPGYGLDEAAVAVIKASSKNWKPGFVRGKVAQLKYNLSINFNLSR